MMAVKQVCAQRARMKTVRRGEEIGPWIPRNQSAQHVLTDHHPCLQTCTDLTDDLTFHITEEKRLVECSAWGSQRRMPLCKKDLNEWTEGTWAGRRQLTAEWQQQHQAVPQAQTNSTDMGSLGRRAKLMEEQCVVHLPLLNTRRGSLGAGGTNPGSKR